MKKLLFYFALPALLLASACSNDFEVTAPWKEIPVTYAILDANAPAQYIRVEKAFLDEQVSALRIAQIADSLYYPAGDISVFLEQLNGTTVVKSSQLTRVDGRDEGIVRDSGVFANQPNWLYKLSTTGSDTLIEGAKYRLVIKRANGKPDITGTTTIPNAFRWAEPIATTLSSVVPKLNFDTAGKVDVAWRTDENGVFFNVSLTMKYKETDPITGQTIGAPITLVWDMAKNVKRNDTPSTTTPPLNYKGSFESPSIYEFLHDHIAPTNDRHRYFLELSFTVEGGGKEIERFLETISANSGITGAEVIPLYSNMSEGYGLLTGKNKYTQGSIRMGTQTIERIMEHPLTKALNFRI